MSFLVQSNRKPLDTHFHTRLMRGRKVTRRVMFALLLGGAAWVAVESARALTVF